MRASIGKSALLVTFVANLVKTSPVEASCVPGFDYAAFGKDSVQLGGGADTDSYDSSLGGYATTVNATSGGNLGTNGTACGSATLLGASTTIGGDIQYGSTGTACSVSAGAATVVGTVSALPTNITLTSVTVPGILTYPMASPANVTVNNGVFTTLTPGLTYGTVDVRNGGTLTLTSGTYVIDDLSVAGTVIVTPGPVVVYIKSGLGMTAGALVNSASPQKSTNLVFMVAATCPSITLRGGSNVGYAVYAPDSDITIAGGAEIYGAVVGKTITNMGGTNLHYDAALGSFAGGGFACPPAEVSRASPVIASILGDDAIVQGTYEYPFSTKTQVVVATDVTAFRFPYIQGHMRASKISQFGASTTNFTGRTGSNEIFDSKTLIPTASYAPCAMFDATCRTVFTTIVGGANPARVHLSSTTAATLVTYMAVGLTLTTAQRDTLIERILKGDDSSGTFVAKLGGMDRSTVAVIPFSLAAGSARPTMIYAGGTDGMLHAFCGDNTSPCTVGKELWAYIPRVLLDDLRLNDAIIDGSPRVVDMFGDFDNDGKKTFSTILLLQTGTGKRVTNKTPAVYALDITNPTDPKVIWERTTASVAGTAGTFELGQGQVIAAGQVTISGAVKNAAFVQTNNGAGLRDAAATAGAGSSASIVYAINVDTGADLWAPHTYAYPNPHVAPRAVGDAAVPKQAVPGGVVGFDSTNTGIISELVFGTIYGDLWVLDPATGLSKFGTGPLFRLTNNFEPIGAPPAIFAESGAAYAVAATGGYWDRTNSTWNTATNQHLFAIKIKTTSVGFPFSELTAPSPAALKFVSAFSGGQKASAQVLIVGSEIFYTTDTKNINSASYGTGAAGGAAYKTDLAGTQTGSDTVVVTGVGSLASSGGNVYASGGKGSERLSFATNGSTGDTVNGGLSAKVTRRLWLRTL